MTTPTIRRGLDIEALIQEAVRSIWEGITDLPPAPENGKCSCGNDQFTLFEHGYVRWSSASKNDGYWVGSSSGMDDFSAEGETQILVCDACDAAYSAPVIEVWS